MKFERGGTIVGFIVGVVVGLGAALAVAVYVTKVPVPFMNKSQSRSADQDAAEALGITAHRLKALGVIDKIVTEPVGGAQRDIKQMASHLKRALNDAFRQVSDLKVKELLDRRYDRLQSYGRYTDTKAEAS